MEYQTCPKEVTRRERSFTRLIIFFGVGLAISSFDLIIIDPFVSLITALVITTLLLISRILTFNSLKKISQIKYILHEKKLERINNKLKEEYLLDNVLMIRVKRTKNNIIRELKIVFKSGEIIYINGLHDFEKFLRSLLEKCNKEVEEKEVKEPIDYDDPMFYVIFGFLLGVATTIFVRTIVLLSAISNRNIFIVFMIYNIILSSYIMISRPLAKSYGKKFKKSDYVLGVLILLFNIVIYLCVF